MKKLIDNMNRIYKRLDSSVTVMDAIKFCIISSLITVLICLVMASVSNAADYNYDNDPLFRTDSHTYCLDVSDNLEDFGTCLKVQRKARIYVKFFIRYEGVEEGIVNECLDLAYVDIPSGHGSYEWTIVRQCFRDNGITKTFVKE